MLLKEHPKHNSWSRHYLWRALLCYFTIIYCCLCFLSSPSGLIIFFPFIKKGKYKNLAYIFFLKQTHTTHSRGREKIDMYLTRGKTLSFKYKPHKSIRKKMIYHGIIFIQNKQMTQKSTRDCFKQKKEKTKMEKYLRLFQTIINKLYYKFFGTIFMENIKSCQQN